MQARTFLLTIAVASAWAWAAPAAAHCDTRDGPVVGAAHRALETGQVEPPIAAADSAPASGQPAEVEHLLVERTQAGLRKRFDDVAQKKSFAPIDVDAGRAFVGAYVDYVHYVERLYDAAAPTADPHAAHEHEVQEPKAAARASATSAAKHAH